MKILGNLIKKESPFILPIPFKGKVEVLVKRGEQVKSGDILFRRSIKKIIQSHHLPTELGIKVQNSGDYIARLNGEFVTKGEVLAERLAGAGLIVKRVNALEDGIISLDRLEKGYIDIMSTSEESDIIADFRGEIERIDANNGLYIKTAAWIMNIITSMKGQEDEFDSTFIGEFLQLGDGSSVYSQKDLKESYEGKIIYAGRFVYPDLIRELYKRGAELVVGYAMDYDEYALSNDPIILLGGFGNVSYDSHWSRAISSMFNSFTVVNIKSGYIAWADNGQFMNRSFSADPEEIVVDIKVGSKVLLLDLDHLNKVGVVREITSEGFSTVELDDMSTILIDEAFLRPVNI